MHLIKRTGLLTLLFYSSFTAYSQTKEVIDTVKLSSYLRAIHLKTGFSGELLVAHGTTVLFQKTTGMASYENNLALRTGAKYRIASISKTFTGALIALAEEEQRLSINDKVSSYIKELSPEFGEVTIEQLLTHTSGLPHNEGIDGYWQIKSKLPMTREQAISEINALDLLFTPGSAMGYSSLGYYLLAVVLENIYQQNFQDILQSKILKKLQMDETGLIDNLKILPRMASGYHLITDDSLVVAPYRDYSMLKGAGDMYSTATDLLKWNTSFFSNLLLKENTKAIIPKAKAEHNAAYGYGWFITPDKYYHGGGTWGYSTHTAVYPEQNLSIILLSNVSTLPISSIAEDVEKIVFGKPFQLPLAEEKSKEEVNLEMYHGNFLSETNSMLLVIKKVENSLYAQLGTNPAFEIYPKGGHQFFGKKVEIEFTFNVAHSLVTGVSAKRAGQIFYFKKTIR
jgi:CubicO group peptidase (beta-lactamase class C family)